MEEFYIVRARGDDVLLRLLRMMREGRIDMKPLNRMDDAELVQNSEHSGSTRLQLLAFSRGSQRNAFALGGIFLTRWS
jgi:hypothetical protein